jgi:hypothetical protein
MNIIFPQTILYYFTHLQFKFDLHEKNFINERNSLKLPK